MPSRVSLPELEYGVLVATIAFGTTGSLFLDWKLGYGIEVGRGTQGKGWVVYLVFWKALTILGQGASTRGRERVEGRFTGGFSIYFSCRHDLYLGRECLPKEKERAGRVPWPVGLSGLLEGVACVWARVSA